jgi:hypothetical protein
MVNGPLSFSEWPLLLYEVAWNDTHNLGVTSLRQLTLPEEQCMHSEKRRPSCRDQFDRPPEPQPERDDWIESFIARLRSLVHRMGGKK